MNEMNLFLYTIKYLQKLHTSFYFSRYEMLYRKLFTKMFTLSSVSFSFRVVIRPNIRKKLNFELKEKLREEVLKFVNEKGNYIKQEIKKSGNSSDPCEPVLNINSIENFLEKIKSQYFENFDKNKSDSNKILNDCFSVQLLLVKRAASERDKYSGNIAFPGGKFEKEDRNDFNTAVRETKEEIDLNLCQDNPMTSRYLGYNTSFDITLDFQYVVSSHIFIIFDFFEECEDHFILSTNELSDVLFVPLKYLLDIDIKALNLKSNTTQRTSDLVGEPDDKTEKQTWVKYITQKVMGQEVYMRKLILNHNENFLIYGLTLRKIINLLNIDGGYNIKYADDLEFIGKNKKIKKVLFNSFFTLFKFSTNPLNSYRLLKFGLMIIITYYILNYIYNNYIMKSKF